MTKKKREVNQFDLITSRLYIVSTVVHTICQMYFGGLSIRQVPGSLSEELHQHTPQSEESVMVNNLVDDNFFVSRTRKP